MKVSVPFFKKLSFTIMIIGDFPEATLEFLESKGHTVLLSHSKAEVQGVVMDADGQVTAHSDSRKSGRAIIVEETTEPPGK